MCFYRCTAFLFQGIFISRVSEEGPAARAGVKVGDKLLEVNIFGDLSSLSFPLQSGSFIQYSVLVIICSQVNGVDLHGAEHHTAVEALRNSGAAVVMTVLRERMVEPENAITTTPLRPEDDYFPRERRSSGLPFLLDPDSPTVSTGPAQRLATCLIRNDKGLGFSIAGGKGSTLYRVGDTVNKRCPCRYTSDLPCSEYLMVFISLVSGFAVFLYLCLFTKLRTPSTLSTCLDLP